MEMNRRIRGSLGIATTDEGKAVRPSPEQAKPEDKEVRDLTSLETPELVGELQDATSKAREALDAAEAVSEELTARLAEEDSGQEGELNA